MEQAFDVVILGGGPGGTAAAKTLIAHGKSVALVEEGSLGGVCLNFGCIPTKFFLAATAPIGLLHAHRRFGTITGEASVAYAELQKRKNRFIMGSSLALEKSLRATGIVLFRGRGKGISPGIIAVEGKKTATLRGQNIILATGSHPASFSGIVPDGKAVLDSTMLLSLDQTPSSLLIVGGGAIGIEFSDFFAALGTRVTLVEAMPQLIPTEDFDIAEELRKILQRSGRICLTGRKVASLSTQNGNALLLFEDGEALEADKALVAIGRIPNTAGLGVDALGGSLTPRGVIAVNDCLQTAPQCYAIGDVNGIMLLAHAAEHQGEWVARHILGEEKGAYTSGPVPSCIFGHTEVMRVGNTAREAQAAGGNPFVSTAPFSVNPIAQAYGTPNGLAKAVWLEGTLVGMAAVGHDAAHLITAAQLLVLEKYTVQKLHRFMFAHPTLDEVLKSALTAPATPFVERVER